MFWNFMRVRYMTNSSVKLAFGGLRQWLDGLLVGPQAKIPFIGALYVRVRDFLSKMTDPQQAQQGSSCTVM
jgi:hypothetical protein